MVLSEFAGLFEKFAEQNKSHFNQLDAAQGDGDLGITIVNGAKALHIAAQSTNNIQEWFTEGGKAFRKAAPSTMGILIASALIGVGKKLEPGQDSLSPQDCIVMQETMIEEIQKRGGAKLGDKTILDALIPASNAFAVAIHEGKSTEEALKSAAEAAKRSANATAELESKIGRSSWLGERAKGNVDGGAWFCYLTYDFLSSLIRQ